MYVVKIVCGHTKAKQRSCLQVMPTMSALYECEHAGHVHLPHLSCAWWECYIQRWGCRQVRNAAQPWIAKQNPASKVWIRLKCLAMRLSCLCPMPGLCWFAYSIVDVPTTCRHGLCTVGLYVWRHEAICIWSLYGSSKWAFKMLLAAWVLTVIHLFYIQWRMQYTNDQHS